MRKNVAMTHRKKLIEVALPLEAINAASAREKSIRHGHPSTLHLWWARRPLAACRAVIFASLVDDPNDPDAPPEFVQACRELHRGRNAAENDTPRQRLFDFIETLVKWESTTDEDVLETARRLIWLATDGNPPPLLDPFAGGGSIPLEALRLGLEAHASDLNPVPVIINKAQIEIPSRFTNIPPVNPQDRSGTAKGASWNNASGLAADVRYYGKWMREKAWEKIGSFYPKKNGETVIAWIWARTVKSPNPAVNTYVPLTNTFWLSKRKDKAWVKPIIDKNNREYQIRIVLGAPPDPEAVDAGTKVGRATFACLLTDVPITADYIRAEALAGRMGRTLLGIITEGTKGRNYHSPDVHQVDVANSAHPSWKPDIALATNPRHMSPTAYGLLHHSDLYTERQLTALSTFAELVERVRTQILKDAIEAGIPNDGKSLRDGGSQAQAYAEAISVYLSFAISRGADYWSSLAMWADSFIAHTFSRNALPIVWDFAEANPFSESTGNWLGAIDWIARVIDKFVSGPAGTASQRDAANAKYQAAAALISTDPPYYDNVPYADLADYFYVWLRKNLENVYPEIFSTLLTPKEPEIVADADRFGGKEAAQQHFENGLQQAFCRMRDAISPNYPLTVYYAFKQSESETQLEDAGSIIVSNTGWETMLESLIQSGFVISGTWPVRTERSGRMRSIGSNALASSIVLVCRPRPDDAPMTSRRDFVSALRRELPVALREMQSGNIAPVDLAQASIGPGMAVYSRYARVLEPNGDRLTVRTALQLINHELDAYLAEQEGYIDEDSRFAVAWFEQYGFNAGEFGVADVLARAKNTSVEGLAHTGLLESGAGKVRLRRWDELDPGWDPATDEHPTVWQATHHLIERLNTHGEDGAARLLAKMPSDLAAQARQLAYRLYSICERKGWAEHARDYNALVVSWGASQEQAREFKEQYQQGKLF